MVLLFHATVVKPDKTVALCADNSVGSSILKSRLFDSTQLRNPAQTESFKTRRFIEPLDVSV